MVVVTFAGAASVSSGAIAPGMQFRMTTPGGNNYRWEDIASLPDGSGYVLAGSNSTDLNHPKPAFGKVTSNGNEVWVRDFYNAASSSFSSVALTSDGGFVAAAGFTTSLSEPRALLVKVNGNGEEVWNKTHVIPGLGFFSPYTLVRDVIQTTDGGYIVVGMTADVDPSSTARQYDFFLLKLRSNGDLEWSKTIQGWVGISTIGGGWNINEAEHVMQISDGYVFSGYSGDPTGGPADAVLIKTDTSGNLRWNSSWHALNLNFADDFEQTPEGGFMVAIRTVQNPGMAFDARVIKTDRDGNTIWNKAYASGTYVHQMFYSIARSRDGGYVLGGEYGKGSPDWIWHAWLFKIDSNGAEQWDNAEEGAPLTGAFADVQQLPDGGYIAFGSPNILAKYTADMVLTPAATARNATSLDVFTKGTDNALWWKHWSSTEGWSAKTPLGGYLTSDPAVVYRGSGKMDVFARGGNGALWMRSTTNGGSTWTGWTSLGGGILQGTGPAVSPRLDGYDAFVTGNNGAVWQKTVTTGGTIDWHSLGGSGTSSPAAASRGTNQIDVFVRGKNEAPYQTTTSNGGSTWTAWQKLDGLIDSSTSPAVTARAGGLELFVTGHDHQLYQKTLTGTTWSGWQSLGGSLTSSAGAASRSSTAIDVFVRGGNGGLWQRTYNSGWGAWTSVGGI